MACILLFNFKDIIAFRIFVMITFDCIMIAFWNLAFPLFDRTVFTWVRLLWFCIATLGDWLKNFAPLFSQSELKPKPIVTRARTFSRAFCQLHVFALRFDWFTGFSVSFVIGQSNYFGFGFTTLNWKLLYSLSYVIRKKYQYTQNLN